MWGIQLSVLTIFSHFLSKFQRWWHSWFAHSGSYKKDVYVKNVNWWLEAFEKSTSIAVTHITALLEYRHTSGNVQLFISLSFLFGTRRTMFIPHSSGLIWPAYCDWFSLCFWSSAVKQENIYIHPMFNYYACLIINWAVILVIFKLKFPCNSSRLLSACIHQRLRKDHHANSQFITGYEIMCEWGRK